MTITTAQKPPTATRYKGPASWRQLSAELLQPEAAQGQQPAEKHTLHWWQRCGFALAVLLHNAGYPSAAQLRILRFLATVVAPNLGAGSGEPLWQSFMTDDHRPVELSWDWHKGDGPPTVRFSVEPVGLDAGGPSDLYNRIAPARLKAGVGRALPDADMRWFDHFSQYFTPPGWVKGGAGSPQTGWQVGQPQLGDHPSTIFWAFDLAMNGGIMSKAYFFPGLLARATGRTNLEVIAEAIASAPIMALEATESVHSSNRQATLGTLDSLDVFTAYAREVQGKMLPPLEADMLAIDMAPAPAEQQGRDRTDRTGGSRIKIYFRSRRTSFASVREAMTMGGRVVSGAGQRDHEVGMARLRRLWDDLFMTHGADDDTTLPELVHRTAGILYYVELRAAGGGGARPPPKVKVYLPVRHYAGSDWQVLTAVSRFVDGQRGEVQSAGGGAPRAGDPFAYTKALYTVFKPESLFRGRGIHTYVACSIEVGGELRVVSYLNLQEAKLRER